MCNTPSILRGTSSKTPHHFERSSCTKKYKNRSFGSQWWEFFPKMWYSFELLQLAKQCAQNLSVFTTHDKFLMASPLHGLNSSADKICCSVVLGQWAINKIWNPNHRILDISLRKTAWILCFSSYESLRLNQIPMFRHFSYFQSSVSILNCGFGNSPCIFWTFSMAVSSYSV